MTRAEAERDENEHERILLDKIRTEMQEQMRAKMQEQMRAEMHEQIRACVQEQMLALNSHWKQNHHHNLQFQWRLQLQSNRADALGASNARSSGRESHRRDLTTAKRASESAASGNDIHHR